MTSLSLCGMRPLLKTESQATNMASHRSILCPIMAWKPGSGARCSRHLSIYGRSLVVRSCSISSIVMCGRYAVTSAPEAIRALFGYPEQPNFPPRYNVAPTQPIAIVRLMDGKRQFALVRWGLLPSWVKDPKDFTLVINARGESVMDKPAFSAAMKRRRCLVPADGFYEWKAIGAGKQPFYVRAKSGAPLAFAGLWETWTGPNGEEMETAAIVTTRANRTLAGIHEP